MMTDKKEPISIVEVQLKNFINSKRPKDEEVRKQLDFGYSWDEQTVLLFEIRPQWNDPKNIINLPFAKLRFMKASKIWKLYWMRGSGKWEAYQPKSESTNLQLLLNEIDHDEYGCFFG
ncbi:DUF3024 domain-containing protein [Sphingobacterium cellulitidis]|uniref:DUF3024 domain-containing protein n=1 Tax=Sphingobacterium cellulitidis TaxID=1768011 RepID=A0A8H9KTG0_9SPHI|nr:DUF3024 domain-containing protein [Sphingobacterium soli]MBA8984990.1 hypothetical protein [Sphingobacterium soli]GGE13004.1 hypothetical protein GCM10011516_08460 [Sphingobacterium soli]